MSSRFTSLTRAAATVGALALVAAGCGATSSSGSETETPDTLNIGVVNSVSTLDPHATNTVLPDLSVLGSVYSSLVTLSGGEMSPSVAASWDTPDNTTWTFTLDPDVTFSDGTALDASVVKWNFDRVLAPDSTLRAAGGLSNVAGVEAPDPTTVVITLERPDSEFLSLITSFFLLSPGFVEANDPTTAAMGSGPYQVVSHDPGGNTVLEATPDYWGDAPAIDSVTFVAQGSYDAGVSSLLAQETSLVPAVNPADVSRIDSTDGVATAVGDSNRSAFLDLNTTKAPLGDVRVRQALNYAVDKEAIVEAVLFGTGSPSTGQVLNSTYDAFNTELEAYPYDPERARELLAEAGFADGFVLNVDNPSDTYIASEEVLQAIGAQLAEVGVSLEIENVPFDSFMDRFIGENADMEQSIYLSQASASAGRWLSLFEQSSVYSYWDDPQFTALLDAARYSTADSPTEEKYAEVTAYMREQAPVLFLFTQPAIYGVADGLSWTPRSDGYLLPAEMSFE